VRKHRVFLFISEPGLPEQGHENKKTRQTPQADAGLFSLGCYPLEDHEIK